MRLIPVLLATMVALCAFAPPAAASASVECRTLLDGRQVGGWEAVDGTLTQTNVEGEPALLLRAEIDPARNAPGRAGGRPRLQLSLPPEDRDWRGWEQIRVRLLARSSNGSFPSRPLGISIASGDQARGSDQTAPALEAGKWLEFAFDLAGLADPAAVRSVALSTFARRYGTKTTVEFAIARLELLRYSRPTLIGLQVRDSIAFADAASLSVQVKALGLSAGATAPVALRLSNEHGTVTAQQAQAGEGETQLALSLPRGLSVGEYAVSATIGDDTLSAPVQLVASPWQEVK